MQNTIQFDMAEVVSRQAKALSRQYDMECDCHKHCVTTALPDDPQVTMAYVPFQGRNSESYPCDKALTRGTMFPCLDKPFLMGCCK